MAKRKYKIINNKTIEQYKEKYSSVEKKLASYSEDEVSVNPNLLKGSAWWKIEDRYYQVPAFKDRFIIWWGGLESIYQIIVPAVISIIIALIIAIPIAVNACR